MPNPGQNVMVTCTKYQYDLMPWKTDQKKVSNRLNGILLKHSNILYVLTCFHGVKNSIDIMIYIFKKNKNGYALTKESATLESFVPEFDLAILKLNNSIEEVGDSTSIFANTTFPKENVLLNFDCPDISRTTKNTLKIDYKTHKLKFINIDFEKLAGFLGYPIPLIKIDGTELVEEYPELEHGGISGCCVYNNNIVGIISNINKDTQHMSIIPNYIINLFLTEYLEKGYIMPKSCIPATMNIICMNKERENMYIVTNVFSNQSINLKKNDMIFKIDGKKFDDNGLVYDEKINLSMPLQTYIALNYAVNEPISLSVVRLKTLNSYKYHKISLNSYPLEQMKYITTTYDGKYIQIAGFTFIELTEDMIHFLEDCSIILIGTITKYYKTRPFRVADKKIIVLIDMDTNQMADNIATKANELGLPILHQFKSFCYLPVITKINGEKISSLNQLNQLINGDNNKVSLSLSEKISMAIEIKNNICVSIKFI